MSPALSLVTSFAVSGPLHPPPLPSPPSPDAQLPGTIKAAVELKAAGERSGASDEKAARLCCFEHAFQSGAEE